MVAGRETKVTPLARHYLGPLNVWMAVALCRGRRQ